MRYYQGRQVIPCVADTFDHLTFRVIVQSRRGFVQEKHVGGSEESPGQREALSLASGDAVPEFAHGRLIALRERSDELVCLSEPGDSLYPVVVQCLVSEPQVFSH